MRIIVEYYVLLILDFKYVFLETLGSISHAITIISVLTEMALSNFLDYDS